MLARYLELERKGKERKINTREENVK